MKRSEMINKLAFIITENISSLYKHGSDCRPHEADLILGELEKLACFCQWEPEEETDPKKMNFFTAFYLSIKENRGFRRIIHHFTLSYIPETGDLHTGYNNEIFYPSKEDIDAQDWILV